MNWPIGDGDSFRGFVDRAARSVHLFTKGPRTGKAAEQVLPLDDPEVAQLLGPAPYSELCDELHVLDSVGAPFNSTKVVAGCQSPVFFGSALTNFGVEFLLQGFLNLSSSASARESIDGTTIDPHNEQFVGHVFKLQANLDPKHRDRMAFLRVCSGPFVRGMKVCHSRTKRFVNLSQAQSLFAQVSAIIPAQLCCYRNLSHF